MESMKQKVNWNTSTDEAEEVPAGTFNNDGDAELTEIMKVVLNNCV